MNHYKSLKQLALLFLISIFACTSLMAQILDADYYSSYRPIPNENYVISGWVYEVHDTAPLTYDSVIKVSFKDINDVVFGTEEFAPSGTIIDNWQRIIGNFTIPSNAVSIEISLVNRLTLEFGEPSEVDSQVYFDDIRVHPFNGNLKSFVYDPATQRLLAELDENNYATYYDYDKEGGLVRVKKETEKGVYTIQETRSSTSKINND